MAWRPDVLVWALEIVRLEVLGIDYLEDVATFTEGPLDVLGGLESVHTPGHTPGHVAFHLPTRGALVAGDALMTEHPVRTCRAGMQLPPGFFNHDNAQAVRSLKRLRHLDADVVVSGHGPAYHGTPATVAQALADTAGA